MYPTIYVLGFPLDTYALISLLGFFVVFMSVLLLKPRELPFGYVFGGVSVVLVSAFTGAVLLNIIINFQEHAHQRIWQMVLTAGAAYLGALFLGFLAFWLFCRIINIPFLVFADFAAPFFMLERIIGRLGCLAYGCCYGIPSQLPWAYTFRSWGVPTIVPRHPTQAYMMIYAIAIFVSGRYLYKKTHSLPGVFAFDHKQAPSSGIVFFYILLCYGTLRFFNEFLRAEGPFLYGPVKISHLITFAFAVISAVGLFIVIRRSASRLEILKALKGAVLRLALWLAAGSTFILSAISMLK